MKKYFLGLCGNYSGKATLRHLFATGTRDDSEALRRYLADTYHTPDTHIALTGNGRSALALAVKTLVPKRSQVIINGFTCQAVVEAVIAAGCTPIYADITRETFHLDLKSFRETLHAHPAAKAVIFQHTLGHPVPTKLYQFAKHNHLIIIDDLAHTLTPFNTDTDAYALSFGKGKVIDTITGGALILKDRQIKQPNQRQPLASTLRARLYPLFAAVARTLTPTIFAKIWLALLLKLHLIERSADAKLDTKTRLTHWQAKLALRQLRAEPKTPRTAILVKNREELLQKLKKSHFYYDEIWYDVPISPARNYHKWHFPEAECPIAAEVATEVINLPTYYSAETQKPANKLIKEHQK